MSVLQLSGDLSVTKKTVTDVGTLLDTSVQFELVTAARETNYDTGSFAFYIEAAYNMNSAITYTPSNGTDSLDDAYALSSIVISSADARDPLLSLPTTSNLLVDAGLIDALDPSSNLLGTFPVTLTLSVNNQGVLSSSIAISGSDVQANVTDSNLLAQVAYWPLNGVSPPDVNAETADNLNQAVSAAELTVHFASQLNIINGQYNNKNLIESWVLTLNEIPSSTTNSLANYARATGNSGSSNVFNEGEKIVAATPFPYELKLNDYAGNERVLVASQNVYGVIVHRL